MPTLTNGTITFHTNDEDKDDDTLVTLTIQDANNIVCASISNVFDHFDDNSDAGPFALASGNASGKADIQSGTVTLRIDPNGNDTWRFNFYLNFQFSDGSSLSGGVQGLVLNQDQREQIFALEGMLTTSDGPKPYDLVGDNYDVNGLLMNPSWGYQVTSPGMYPTPQPPPNEPWTRTQTNWNIGFDSEWSCGGIGHANWLTTDGKTVGTYDGLISWDQHSDPGADDDYNFNLLPNGGASLQTVDAGVLHLEFSSDEVIDRFEDIETPWWQAFHAAVDDDDTGPVARGMVSERYAVVIGLLGLDQDHDNKTEIHPVWAMAMRVKDDDPNDEVYAFMARNWGNEGYCSDKQWLLEPAASLSLLLPWRPGATSIITTSWQFSIVNAADSDLNKNVSVVYAPEGILLTFLLKPQPQDEPDEDGTVIEGELHIAWGGTDIQQHIPVPTAYRPPSASAEQGEADTEKMVEDLLQKMTPEQRAGFYAALPKRKTPSHRGMGSGTATQMGHLPLQQTKPPRVNSIHSHWITTFKEARLAALHQIFGEHIPGFPEHGQVGRLGAIKR